MRQIDKVRLCLGLNVVLLTIVVVCITVFASDSPYFRVGPNDAFVLISVHINTMQRYVLLLLLISVMNCIKVVVSEVGEPVLVFTVYNPDKKIITDFSRVQLLMYANLMFFVSNTRRVFEVMITVTQFDIAIFSIVVEQMFSVCTVCFLVREKEFEVENGPKMDTPSEGMDEGMQQRRGPFRFAKMLDGKFLVKDSRSDHHTNADS